MEGRYPARAIQVPFDGGVPINGTTRYHDGFEILDDDDTGVVAMHDGASPGFSAFNAVYASGLSISILTNCDRLDGLDQLARLLYGMVS